MRVEVENNLIDCSGTITQFQINGYNIKWRPNLTVRISYKRSNISPSLTSLFTSEFRLQNLWVMALPSWFLPSSPFLTSSLLHFKALSFGQSQTFRVLVLYFALSNFLKSSLLYLVGSSALSKPILHIQTLVASNAVVHSFLCLQCLAAAIAVQSIRPPQLLPVLSSFDVGLSLHL